MPDYTALMQSYQNKLAEQRLLLSQWASAVFTQYDALPDEVKETLPKLPGRSPKELVPALYADPVTPKDAEDYKAQIAVLDNFVAACNQKVSELNASEAVRCKLS